MAAAAEAKEKAEKAEKEAKDKAKAVEDKAKEQFERIELEQTLKNIINVAIIYDGKEIKKYNDEEIKSFINKIYVIDNGGKIQIQLEQSNDNNALTLEGYIENLLGKYPKVDDSDTGKLDNEIAMLYSELENNSKLLFKIHEGEEKNTIKQAKINVATKIGAEAAPREVDGKVDGEETTINKAQQEFLSQLLLKYDNNIYNYDLISIIVNAYLLRIRIYIEKKKLTAARTRGNNTFGRMLGRGGGSKKRKYSFKKLPKRKRRNNKSNKTQVKKRGKRLNRSKKMSR